MKSLFIWLILVRYVRSYIILLNSTDKHMDRIASFGPSLTDDGITGNLQVAIHNGCQAVPPPCDNWIALVERGNCTFIDKVRFMQQSNAKAVIVGDRYSSSWVSMYTSGDSFDITIPSVYVPRKQFLSLLNQLHKNNDLSIPVKLTSQSFLFSRSLFDMIFTTIIPPTTFVFIVYFIWKLRQQSQRRRRRSDRKRNKRGEEFSHLPLKAFCEKKGETDECVICLDEYQRGDILRVLPCKHKFHSQCIDTWLLTRKKYCPICKRDAFQPDENTPLL